MSAEVAHGSPIRRKPAFSGFFMALSGQLQAHLSRQPASRQVAVGQCQRRKGTAGLRDQPAIAHPREVA